MEWKGRRQSTNVSDRRGSSSTGKFAVGGIGSFLVIGLLVFGLLTGYDTSGLISIAEQFTGGNPAVSSGTVTPGELTQEQQDQLDFIETILADSEDIWAKVFADNGLKYRPCKLVLFSGSVQTPSGLATSASGPFYSPADETIYIDLAFFDEMRTRFGADVKANIAGESGDFVVAYVIAHEVGHHVQYQLGILDDVNKARKALSKTEGNKWSVACELQADYFAGVFAHYIRELGALEAGDIAAALKAAESIGDDNIQQEAYGYVKPDTFTHGSAKQRAEWFTKGYESGTLYGGDPYKALGLK